MRWANDNLSLQSVKVGLMETKFQTNWISLKFSSDYHFTQTYQEDLNLFEVGGRSRE